MKKYSAQYLGIKVVVGTLVLSLISMVQPATVQAVLYQNMEANIFLPNSGYNISLLTSLENDLGVSFTSAKWYQDFSDTFDTSVANRFHSNGKIPELTFQPLDGGSGIVLSTIVAGTYDSQLVTMANQVKSLGYTIRINLAPEMNGDWCAWGVFVNNNTNTDFVSMYRHVVDVFRSQGATNVEWIWAPNVHIWNEKYTFAELYPGDGYVTYTGLDGYNWGTSQSWSEWQSFSQVFGPSYNSLVALTSKRILITEMASAEAGGNKAEWITDMVSSIKNTYPRIQGFTWFNINKETDWRIESSVASKMAFTRALKGLAIATPTPSPTINPVTGSTVTQGTTEAGTKATSTGDTSKPRAKTSGFTQITATVSPGVSDTQLPAEEGVPAAVSAEVVGNATPDDLIAATTPATMIRSMGNGMTSLDAQRQADVTRRKWSIGMLIVLLPLLVAALARKKIYGYVHPVVPSEPLDLEGHITGSDYKSLPGGTQRIARHQG